MHITGAWGCRRAAGGGVRAPVACQGGRLSTVSVGVWVQQCPITVALWKMMNMDGA